MSRPPMYEPPWRVLRWRTVAVGDEVVRVEDHRSLLFANEHAEELARAGYHVALCERGARSDALLATLGPEDVQ